MDRLAVIILNWNGIEDTMLCFNSLLKQTVSEFKIVIIDNGSIDSSRETLEKLQKDNPDNLTVLYNPYNKGFAGGANTGITWSIEHGFETVALLNNDAIADKRWIENLVKVMEDETVGIATGLLLTSDGKKIDSTGEQYSKWGLSFPRNRGQPGKSAHTSGYTFGATGGASLYRTALLRDIGLFDETFFAYYEDVDISFRAQLAGWKVSYTSEAIAYHQQGATSSKLPGFTVYQTFKNLPLIYIKNVPGSLLFSVGIRFWFAYVMMLGHAIKKGNSIPALKGYIKSIVLFWGHALPARYNIQTGKKVETSYIRELLWPDLPPDQTGLRKVRRFFIGK